MYIVRMDEFNLFIYVVANINLARHKNVSASSGENSTSFLVDGNVSTAYFSTATGHQWIEVDLGKTYDVRSFALYNAQNSKIVNFKLYIFGNNRNLIQTFDFDHWGTEQPLYRKEIVNGVFSRYFRIEFNNTEDHFKFGELEVYGSMSPRAMAIGYDVQDYRNTFQATGCKNKMYDIFDVWSNKEDYGFGEMYDICLSNQQGTATKEQSDACCGSDTQCQEVKCIRQTEMVYSVFKETDLEGIVNGIRLKAEKGLSISAVNYGNQGCTQLITKSFQEAIINGDLLTGGTLNARFPTKCENEEKFIHIKYEYTNYEIVQDTTCTATSAYINGGSDYLAGTEKECMLLCRSNLFCTSFDFAEPNRIGSGESTDGNPTGACYFGRSAPVLQKFLGRKCYRKIGIEPLYRYSKSPLQASRLVCTTKDGNDLHNETHFSIASNQECFELAVGKGFNAYAYEINSNLCVLQVCDQAYSERIYEHGQNWLNYVPIQSMALYKSGYKLINPYGQRKYVTTCPGGKYLDKEASTIEMCLEQAKFAEAQYVNFEMANSTCQLLSCPAINFTIDILSETRSGHRFVPTHRQSVLQNTCKLLETQFLLSVESCGEHSNLLSNSNAFQYGFDSSCSCFSCDTPVSEAVSTMTYSDRSHVRLVEEYFLVYVANDVIPLDYY
eukprot:Awhi_evm1s2600